MNTEANLNDQIMTPSSFLEALDALYVGDWQAIVSKWGEGELVGQLWSTLLSAPRPWMQGVCDLIQDRKLWQPFAPVYEGGLSELTWTIGTHPGVRWLQLSVGPRHFLKSERKSKVTPFVPRISPNGSNYSDAPWTSWEPLGPIFATEGRYHYDFAPESVLGTLSAM